MKNKRKEIDWIIKELNKKGGYKEELAIRLEELEAETGYYPDQEGEYKYGL